MILIQLLVALCAADVALSGISVQRAGWLDRVVHVYRQQFLSDVQEVAPVQIQASVELSPAGYVDSSAWDYASVSRLLALLGASEAAAPVRLALRHALRPSLDTRRFISKQESWKLFPSLGKDHPNEIYYDFGAASEEDKGTVSARPIWGLNDNTVVVLQNPVEARLPSARISVKLLRKILESRALAARSMLGTTRSTIPWIPMNNTSLATQATAETVAEDATDKEVTGNDTEAPNDKTTIITTAPPPAPSL